MKQIIVVPTTEAFKIIRLQLERLIAIEKAQNQGFSV